MLDFIERHKIGILTTIIVHLLLVTLFLVVQFGTLKKTKKETQVEIDFVDPAIMEKAVQQKKEEIRNQAKQEPAKDLEKEGGHTRNIAVNEADKDAHKSIDKMVQDIKTEMNIKDRSAAEKNNQPATRQLPPADKNDVAAIPQKNVGTVNAKGEHTFYKGATTISYFLEGRSHVYLPVPVYQCQGSGKVVMDITVNPNGYVISTSINKAESKITEPCLIDAANRAALSTRFNAKGSAPDKQHGKITYIFIAQ
ncbi:MAG: hypothetical protein Q8928_00255 [Bacteroidota bacterium]|nr:hypothetical protein [Bacteroidota bacterium]